MRPLRVLPLVIVAAALLLGLKAVSLVSDGGAVFAAADPPTPVAEPDPAYRPIVAANLDSPAAAGGDVHLAHDGTLVPPLDPATTGSIETTGAAPKTPATVEGAGQMHAAAPQTKPIDGAGAAGTAPTAQHDLAGSSTEAKLLDELRARQKSLNERARQVDLREALVNAAEKRLQQRVGDLKSLSAKVALPGVPDPKLHNQRMDDLVAVYSGMRAKDAATIFNRLDTAVLMSIATRMKPRVFSDILGQMDPAAAERLTLALAGHGMGDRGAALDALPKIEGRATAQ